MRPAVQKASRALAYFGSCKAKPRQKTPRAVGPDLLLRTSAPGGGAVEAWRKEIEIFFVLSPITPLELTRPGSSEFGIRITVRNESVS